MTPRVASIIVAIVLAATIWLAHDTLLLAFAGILLALLLRSVAEAFARAFRLPMVWSVWLSTLALAAAVFLCLMLLGNAALRQMDQLRDIFPAALRSLTDELRQTSIGVWIAGNSANLSGVIPDTAHLLTGATGIISGAFATVVAVFIVVFVGIAGALEPDLYVDGFLLLFPIVHRERLHAVLQEIGRTLRTWIVARLLTMVATGLLVTLGLSLLHVPLAGALGFVAGVLAFVPNVGAFIAAAPAVVLAFVSSPVTALEVVGMYVAVHIADDFILSPLVERQVVKLPPIVTLVAQIVLGIGAGIVGINACRSARGRRDRAGPTAMVAKHARVCTALRRCGSLRV
ncbi:MAG TPA: AI-2E family transporter [Candidatus Tyrphobacter sp.]